ncbi:MAG: hypothetical protein M1819_004248 [Sarea resinae]|nr:MAG: hypothetical protein M1819_004248 [Sarea resinae]
MSRHPEKVRIKRKKDEEPVDSLYVQTEHQQKKRRFTDFVFRRIQEDEDDVSFASSIHSQSPKSPRNIKRAVSNQVRTGIPAIRTTLPGEELEENNGRAHATDRKGTASPSLTVESIPGPDRSMNASPALSTASSGFRSTTSTGQPRRFHLHKSASAIFLRGQAGSAQKRKRGQKSEVAVLVEKDRQLRTPTSTLSLLGLPSRNPPSEDKVDMSRKSPVVDSSQKGTEADTVVQVSDDKPITTPARKRPLASAAEKRWREENWKATTPSKTDQRKFPETGQTIDSDPKHWDTNSLLLAEQLNQIVLDEFGGASKERSCEANEPVPLPPTRKAQSKLRVQPKVPIQRYRDRHPAPIPKNATPDPDKMETTDDESETEYVYDTYVRHAENSSMDIDAPELADDKVGLLVITEEEHPVWEAFASDDEEEEEDYNSDEDDENAENYYGADYPEDEVASDDEQGEGAYHYRKAASDDEEFDQDTGAWSDEADEESDPRYPWKRNPWDTHSGPNQEADDMDEEA